jgi:hypothetical protein
VKRLDNNSLVRFATESAVIVASILLAFAIDAWWSDRVDRRSFVDHLASIEAELVENQETAKSQLEILGHRILLTNRVLVALSGEEIEISQSTFMSDLGEALTFGRSLRNRHNSIEALKNSSQFGSYENVEFIEAFNNFTGTVQDAEAIEEQRTALYYSDVKPTLERYLVMADLGWTEVESYSEYDENRIQVTPRPEYSSDMVGIRSRDTWNTIFGWKIMLTDYQDVLGKYKDSNEELIGKVRAELKRLR